MRELRVFSGRSNEPLAHAIARYIDSKMNEKRSVLGALDPNRDFADGEIYTRYGENIREADVFIIQSTNQPNTHEVELNLMINTAVLASAQRVTAVIPYFGYARQDRKDKSRAPVTIANMARKIWISGAHRVVLLDVHSNSTPVAFAALNVPADHLWVRPIFLHHLTKQEHIWNDIHDFVVVAPDVGASERARAYGDALGGIPLVVIEKRRVPGHSKVLNVVGEVAGKDVFMIDDMIDTGETLCNAAAKLRERGAKRIFVLATHGVFSKDALKWLEESEIERIFITDSILQTRPLPKKITVVSVAELLGEAIMRIHSGESVSSLFEHEWLK